MEDTFATVRKEIIEDNKASLEEQISNAREIRDVCQYMSDAWNFWDAEIDRLQLEKDNLPQTLFNDEPSDSLRCVCFEWDDDEDCPVHGKLITHDDWKSEAEQAESDYRDLKATEQDARQVGLQ